MKTLKGIIESLAGAAIVLLAIIVGVMLLLFLSPGMICVLIQGKFGTDIPDAHWPDATTYDFGVAMGDPEVWIVSIITWVVLFFVLAIAGGRVEKK